MVGALLSSASLYVVDGLGACLRRKEGRKEGRKVAQSCPTLCDRTEFSRPESWSGEPFPSPGALPNPGVEPRSPALQADSLPAEPQGKPCLILKNIYNQP